MGAAEETRTRWIELHSGFGRELRRAVSVAERGAENSRHIDERLVQCIWHDQLFREGSLLTASGKRVEILEAGRWNTGRGPDFLDARVRIAGQELTGDIEIHVVAADWRHHGHHQDHAYNTVVLHVALEASDDRPYEEKQNGERLERLVIKDFLEPDLDTIRRTINTDDYPYGRPVDVGLCHERFVRLPEAQVREFFRNAGRMRIEEKIARFKTQMASASPRQLIYQSIMTGQGYKSNKTLYFLLSKRAPCEELLDHAADVPLVERADLILCVLLHVAQLFPTQPDFFTGADAATRAFGQHLDKYWRDLRSYFADRLIPPTKRWFSGMRPQGFPPRRLAAVAILLSRLADPGQPLFESFCNRLRNLDVLGGNPKYWKQFFDTETANLTVPGEDHYFQTRFTFGGKPSKPQALLGEPAARSLLFNVFLPLAILHARQTRDATLGENAWAAIDRFPALPSNSVTEFMGRRLFGESGFEKALLRTELMQQALFKIFHSCCAQNERTCTDCTFLNPPFVPVE